MTTLPPGLMPRLLTRQQAAAYVARSGWAFDKEQRAGLWPAPLRIPGRAPRWDRLQLDSAIEMHGGVPQHTGDAIKQRLKEAIRNAS